MTNTQRRHQQVEDSRRDDTVFYRLLRAAESAEEGGKRIISRDWVQAVNDKWGYTATAIEESIEQGYVTIDENQQVRLTDSGRKRLEVLNQHQ